MLEELGDSVGRFFATFVAKATGEEDAAVIRAEVRAYLTTFESLASANALLPSDIASHLATGLNTLLDDYASFSLEHRALVVAAARYFVSEDDASPDTQGVLGLDDDAQVFNYVAEVLGRLQLRITL